MNSPKIIRNLINALDLYCKCHEFTYDEWINAYEYLNITPDEVYYAFYGELSEETDITKSLNLDKGERTMPEKEITQTLIRSLMFYSIINGWELERLIEAYEYLDIPREIVDETLNEGC